MSELNIYQRINAVMKECPYVQKEKAQQGKGVKYDTVIAMIRDLLIKHGIVMVVRQVEMECVSGVEGTKQKVYQGKYELDLVNIDNPTEIVTHSTYSHGMDGGDKAPGKAQTYAVKIMLVKGFGIETGEDDESRADRMNTDSIDQQQIDTLYKLLVTTEGVLNQRGMKLAAAYKFNLIQDIPAKKYDAILKKAQQ